MWQHVAHLAGRTIESNLLATSSLFLSYASGGEDGYVRIHKFDDSYFAFEFDH